MKKENKILLGYGFKLFILGYRVDFTKKHLENMVKRRLKKNKALCDKKLLASKRQYEDALELWTESEKEFLELKALYRQP